jgi:hypothetical protein
MANTQVRGQVVLSIIQFRIGFSTEPDPAFFFSADPDPLNAIAITVKV